MRASRLSVSYGDDVAPVLRPAELGDVRAIAQIYGHAVRGRVATFDVTDPPLSYWRAKLSSDEPGDHTIVVENESMVVGYACTSVYRA